MRRIKIFDTTLRDGEQSPGCWFSHKDRLTLACSLEAIGIDIIEVGFPIACDTIRDSIKDIASSVKQSTLCCLCRTKEQDIDTAMFALDKAKSPRLHIFLATSDLHLEKKLKISRDEALEKIVTAIQYAKQFTDDIQFSAEDATRTDRSFLSSVFSAAIMAGATTINIPDTVGCILPSEMITLIAYLNSHVVGIDKVCTSIHCHNDLGMATANSLAALEASIDQIECTINGIGERAGNAALEEVVMAIKTRENFFGCDTAIRTDAIISLSQWVEKHGGLAVQPNKAIVGKNAFSHESGIHVDGLLKCEKTYEFLDRNILGLKDLSIALGRQSGRQSFKAYLKNIGITLTEEEFLRAFKMFEKLAGTQSVVSQSDIMNLIRSLD